MRAPRQLFSAWMGPGPMSQARQLALNSIILNCGVPFHFITRQNLKGWLHEDYPIHPAFYFLSAVHQCDYLRCYLLHVYGGGYTDIKPTFHNWNLFFALHALSSKLGAGYTEVSPDGVSKVGGCLENEMKKNYQSLIGVCSLIMLPLSEFTNLWFERTNVILDRHFRSLRQSPARHPQDHFGAILEGAAASEYPLAWTELGGDIFHPLVFAKPNQFLHLDMAPMFSNYR